MTNVIVASFENQTKAIEAMHKLSELDSFGDISIYGKAMVRTRDDGKYEILEANNSDGWRTLTGMAVGSLIGALGGPVGFVIGLYAGTAIGLISDVGRQSFDESFVEKVENRMPPGTVSIIAEIDEDSDVFVDNALRPLGAEIKRSDVDFEFDAYVMDQFDEIDKDLSEAREKLKNSAGREKEKVTKKIAELKDRRNKLIANARKDVKNFNDQISDAVAKTRAEFIKKRIARHEEKLRKLNEQLNDLHAKNEKTL
jgi:uncharacterized membrane protein